MNNYGYGQRKVMMFLAVSLCELVDKCLAVHNMPESCIAGLHRIALLEIGLQSFQSVSVEFHILMQVSNCLSRLRLEIHKLHV